MPRDSNGNYVLPAGNPVVSGTIIASGWANPTMSDIGVELTNSLDRQGRGGMLAPFKFLDGTAGAPGMTWTSEPSTGFFRAGASEMAATVAGVPRMRWTGSGVDVWDPAANAGLGAWIALTTGGGTNFAILNTTNTFTIDQKIVATQGTLQIWKDSTPTFALRLSMNLDQADGLGLAHYSEAIGAWRAKFVANSTLTQMLNDQFDFYNANGSRLAFRIDSNAVRLGSQPAGTGLATWQADDLGNVFWNTSGGQLGYQWYIEGGLMASMYGTPTLGGLLLLSKGAALHHWDPNFAFGGVFVSTSAAPGTGGTPGQIWMQTDT